MITALIFLINTAVVPIQCTTKEEELERWGTEFGPQVVEFCEEHRKLMLACNTAVVACQNFIESSSKLVKKQRKQIRRLKRKLIDRNR